MSCAFFSNRVQFLCRMHWKAYFFFNPDTTTRSKDTYDFKSTKNPLSDRLVKGIWRWHAKDDIYKTFQTCRLNSFSVILNSFFSVLEHFCSNKGNPLFLLEKEKSNIFNTW